MWLTQGYVAVDIETFACARVRQFPADHVFNVKG